ncbi:MAG: nucleoside kinase, partial [Clostridia bacterium]|nr:nucleoside kinase [Clostridia bacterium]
MTVIYKNTAMEIEEGTTYLSIAEKVQPEYGAKIILAKTGQKLVELNKTVSAGPRPSNALTLDFITTADPDGHKTYERGATMMFLRAMTHVFGKRIRKLKLEYSIGDGLYFSVELKDADAVTENEAEQVRETMRKYVSDREKFVKTKIPTEEAIELFRRHGMTDKERLFHYRRTSVTNLYRLGNYCDYYYGYMPPDTGYIDVFDIIRCGTGMLLIIPNHWEPDKPGKKEIPAKLFATMHRTTEWGENIGVPTVAALNDAITRGEGRDIILASEAYQEHLIGEAARRIKEENRRIVMIAGPSSSGKTSFSHRLAIQLNNTGLKAHPIACDNYYLERSLTPRDENGEYDFECLEALNVQLFNEQMTALLKGEDVELPTFNFRTGTPEYNGNTLRMGCDDVLVIEGIHGLNEKLSYAISSNDKFKIYISAVTALNIDEHNRIPTTDNREIRRMVRDARTRGFSAANTISRWQSVRRGEKKHIFPYQEEADLMFNSASLYELSVLKTFAEPLLFAIPRDAPEYTEAKRLLKFLEYFLGLSCEDVPRNSLIREFIGGSVFPVG